MHPMLNIAIRAARKAGNHIAKSLENTDKIESVQKGTNDFVTNVDKEAEALIIHTIQTSYPDHSIIAEEGGMIEGKDSDVQWIIDHWMALITSLKVFHTSQYLLRFALRVKLKLRAYTIQC